MPNQKIKAKHVVSFTTGEVKEQGNVVPEPEAAVTSETVTPEPAISEAEATEEAVKAVDAANTLRRPEVEAIETKPLTLRSSKYLDEAPQDPDWTDEEEDIDFDPEDDGEGISTFAEVFIPMHDDSIATVIRKGMVIVCCIVILCCLVALVLKSGSISGTVTPDVSALPKQTSAALFAVLSNL